MIDLVECSAGGGSIAWVDPAGVLKVGPMSAGASPGPASYGRGGELPTATDAQVALGRIGSGRLLGGEVEVDEERAEAAIQRHIAERLDMKVAEAAEGIIEVANAQMEGILRVVSVRRGFDPREFTLVAFGGAGPLHAVDLASALGITEVVVPLYPGLFSAQGLCQAYVLNEFVRTRVTRWEDANLSTMLSTVAALEKEAVEWLDREGIDSEKRALTRSMDMRYVGQNWELTVNLSDLPTSEEELEDARRDFDRLHQQMYGHSSDTDAVEVVSFRVHAYASSPPLKVKSIVAGGKDSSEACTGSREVYFAQGGATECLVYDRNRLKGGNRVDGPAVIEQLDATTVIPPGYAGRVDDYGNIWITPGA